MTNRIDGGSLGILPLGKPGKFATSEAAPLLHAHGSGITDWSFSDFDQELLATGAEDGTVSLAKDTIQARKCNTVLIDQNYAVGEAMEAARGWYFGQCSSKQHLSFEYSITTRQLCQVPSHS